MADMNPARAMAKKRWANTTTAQRLAHSRLMLSARRAKKTSTAREAKRQAEKLAVSK